MSAFVYFDRVDGKLGCYGEQQSQRGHLGISDSHRGN